MRSEAEAATERIRRFILERLPASGEYQTAMDGIKLFRRDEADKAECRFSRPIMAVTVQGAKRTVIGTEEYRYGEGECLVAGVDMPSMSHITEASPARPYLVFSMDIDSSVVAQLAEQLPAAVLAGRPRGSAVAVTSPELLKSIVRLIEILETPEQIPILGPLCVREMHFRLLNGPQGHLLRALNTRGSQSNQVLQAINWLREHYRSPLDVAGLADMVHMAPPTFRKHFRAVTSMSPTQYHKYLRLYEAQRLMLVEKSDTASAGYAVGYESPSHFHRDYKKLFGEPPHANISHIGGDSASL